jgi:hypothetical protein
MRPRSDTGRECVTASAALPSAERVAERTATRSIQGTVTVPEPLSTVPVPQSPGGTVAFPAPTAPTPPVGPVPPGPVGAAFSPPLPQMVETAPSPIGRGGAGPTLGTRLGAESRLNFTPLPSGGSPSAAKNGILNGLR